ncbi:hypothetical protein J4208_04885 [Candidatus Woesearchaeota archaeon]|nr:hypothetical protein [Candidatus Woesearchaeota archaeon]
MQAKVLNSIFITFTLFLSVIAIAYAEDPLSFNPVKGYEFLASKNENGKYENVITTAIVALAFKDVGATAHAEQAFAWLKSQEDITQHCWPKGNCKSKDTAFAIWALNEFGENTDAGEEYLKSALIPALQRNWYLEIVTTNSGSCRISYPGPNGREEETIQVEAGTFPQCTAATTNTFFDLNQCLRIRDVVATRSSVDFDINCADLGASSIISIIYNTQNSYSLVQQATTDRYQAVINNGCFSDVSTTNTCSKDASLFTNWILAQVAASTNVEIWLKTVYDPLKPLDNALFALAAKETTSTYISNLIKAQRNDGSFNNDVHETVFAMLALKKSGSTTELNAATEWLKTKQQSDGSWENVQNTALALYSAFTNVPVSLPAPNFNGPNGAPSCGDEICSGDETVFTCPQDCETISSVCNENSACEAAAGEDSDNCSADCYCGDQICDDYERSTNACATDCGNDQPAEFCGDDVAEGTEECDGADDSTCPGLCTSSCSCEVEESGGVGKWLLMIFIFLLLAAAGFFYVRNKGKGSSKPAGKTTQEYRPFTSQMEKTQTQQPKWNMPSSSGSSLKTKIEDDLDKSLEEAKKLLKKL